MQAPFIDDIFIILGKYRASNYDFTGQSFSVTVILTVLYGSFSVTVILTVLYSYMWFFWNLFHSKNSIEYLMSYDCPRVWINQNCADILFKMQNESIYRGNLLLNRLSLKSTYFRFCRREQSIISWGVLKIFPPFCTLQSVKQWLFNRCLVWSTDQACSCGFYFRIAWKSTKRPFFSLKLFPVISSGPQKYKRRIGHNSFTF